MAQKILLDMIKLRAALSRDSSSPVPEGIYYTSAVTNGLKTIRELAAFGYTCRKCEDAPCIAVCPAEALEKNSDGIINRHTNLCISCKSCVTICPFGTMMTDFFKHHMNKDLYYNLDDKKELDMFVAACPEGTVSFTDSEEMPEKNIYRLNEKVLIRDYLYMTEDH